MDKKEIQEIVDAFSGRMLNYNVCIRKIENVNITENNLDLSMAVDKDAKFLKGIVVSIGSACPKGDVDVGSTIMFDANKSSKVTLNTIEYEICYFADLLHVL